MGNGGNGNGNGERAKMFEKVARSEFAGGLQRIVVFVLGGLICPLAVAAVIGGFVWASGNSATDWQQTRILDRLELKLSTVEEKNEEQDEHLKATDRTVERLRDRLPARRWRGPSEEER